MVLISVTFIPYSLELLLVPFTQKVMLDHTFFVPKKPVIFIYLVKH
ncbi:hypothetical protein NIES4103_20550 [Nostoc sp. NIES-4103]|nr:hypothetical protein NIES4103_20550 [Nostoc sp. NIES-4103]